MERWTHSFFSTTRGRIVELLRRSEATVNDLAHRLGLTDNAIRSHLTALERDELVRQVGRRPATRKPETLYALAPEAERLFPKSYHLLLNELLATLEERYSSGEVQDLLTEVGRRLAPKSPPSGREELIGRANAAIAVLSELGGLAEIEDAADGMVIRGYSCPLAASVKEHPQVCRLAEALLTQIVGVPVVEACDRAGEPRCIFKILPPAAQ